MKKSLCLVLGILTSYFLFSQTTISYNGSGNYELTERTDLRRYDNGRYTGLVSREVSSFIIPVSTSDGYLYDGSFYVLENTKRNSQNVALNLDDVIPSTFKINEKGELTMIVDNGFPSLRSFPTYPEKKISIGDSWEGKAERAVDPLNKGIITKMPIFVRYKYTNDSTFNNEPIFVITAQWATRYGMGSGTYYIDFGGDNQLQKATGKHNATIYVSKKTGNAVLIRDNVDETFFYADGNNIQFKGSISQFTKYPPAIDRTKFLPALKEIANLSDDEIKELEIPATSTPHITNNTKIVDNKKTNQIKDGEITKETDNKSMDLTDDKKTENNQSNNINIKVDNTPAGIRLTIENLQFLPDSEQLVSGDYSKLDDIAEILKSIPNGRFLVEGHTASTGNEKGEMKLSQERAKTIVNELSIRGINENQFICKGSGSTKPIADNSTREGKAKNRRVEITILE